MAQAPIGTEERMNCRWRHELRTRNTLVTLPPLRGRWRVATEGAIDWQFSLCVPLPPQAVPLPRWGRQRTDELPPAARGIPYRSRSEHIECEFTSIYRTRACERISNRAERDISSRAPRDIGPFVDILRSCGIAQFDMCFALDMPRGARLEMSRKRDEKKKKTPAPEGAGGVGDGIIR